MPRRPRLPLLPATAALIGVLLAVAPAAAADRGPMTPEDLWSVVRPGGVSVSPDGARIAYHATAWDLEALESNTDVWMVPAAGGEPVRLTWQAGRDAAPTWSPDGRALYFLSSRNDEKTQVYRLPLEGGEAVRVTEMPAGVSGFALSGNGRRMLVSSSSFRECSDLECVRARRKADEERKATGQLFDGLLYRHWDSWRGDARSHVYLVELDGNGIAKPGDPVDLTPGDVDSPPVSLGSSHDFVLSPDGRFAAVVVNRDERVATSTNNDVELIDLESGERRTLKGTRGGDSGPRFAPDDETVAWISMERAGYESDRHVLRFESFDATRGALLAPDGPELSVSDFLYTAGGATLLLTAQHEGRMNLYSIGWQEGGDGGRRPGRAEEIVRGGRVGSFDASADGRVVAYVHESLTSFPEIHRVGADGTTVRLTGHNDGVAERVELGTPAELWFEGAGGDRVHAWVVRPPKSAVGKGGRGKSPVVWLVHGGPQGAWLDSQHQRWNMQQFAALGYLVVAVNFHGSTGYGQEFTDSINQDWGGKPYEDLMLGLEAAKKEYRDADFSRVCAAGGSYGGYMVNWMLGHAGDRFRCYVSHAGVYDLTSMYGATEELWFPEWDLGGTYWTNPESYARWSPSSYAAKFRTPTLVIHGQLDYRVPVTQGMQLFTALQRQDVPSELLYYPDEGHWILSPANAYLWWETIDAWFERWLDE